MTKIKNTDVYPIKNPVATDYIVGSDSENDGKTVNFQFDSFVDFINSINGNEIISYTFATSPIQELDKNGYGYFLSKNNVINPQNVTELIISKKTKSLVDLTPLFNFIDSHSDTFSLKLRNLSDPNNFIYFNILGITEQEFQFTFSVEITNTDNFLGNLTVNSIYGLDFNNTISINNTDDLPEGSTNLYFTTARVLSTILTGVSFVTGGSISSSDTIISAFGKIQKQINDTVTSISLKLDKGGYVGTAQTLSDAIDAIFVPDQLISGVAPTRSVNTFTYPALGYTALISKTLRTNTAQFITTINAASTTNHKRVDLIYFKSDNTLAKIIGIEDLIIAPRPDVPSGSVGVSFINVFGNVIEDPTPISDEISIQDAIGNQIFTIDNYLRVKGARLNASVKRIEIDPLVGGTIFVSGDGNDFMAELENRNQPFATINNAILAIPNDGKIWTIWQLDGTQTISISIPDRNIVFYSNNSTTLNLATSYVNNNITVRYVFDMPYSTINISTNFLAKQACSLIITCNVLNQISGSSICFSRIFYLSIIVNTLNLIGQFLDQQTQSGATILNFDIVNLTSTGSCVLVDGGNDPSQLVNLKIRRTSANGTLLLCGATGKLVTSIGDFSSSSLGRMFNANTNSVYSITFNDSSVLNGVIQASDTVNNVTLSGRITYTSSFEWFTGFRSLFTLFNCDLTLVNSFLYSRLQGAGFVMYSSYITTSLPMSAGESLPVAMTRPLLKVYGECTIIKTDEGTFFNIETDTTNAYVEEVGTLKINTAYFGNNVGRMVSALSFKEKAKEIVIRAKNDIVNKVLDSTTTYIIDGTITLLTGEYIVVPQGGLTITGYGFDASFISKNILGQSIFSSPVGNSGNLVTRQLTYSPGLGSVFNITDSNGSHAIEVTDVNFQGVTGSSLGMLNGYRQFTGTTCGFYSLSDGIILDGNWSGFKLTNSNVVVFGTSGTLFKKGASLSFSNRFYIDLNIQISTGSKICDFLESNFINDKSLQVVNCYAKINGIVDDNTTSVTFPNITPYSSKSYFVNNIGIKNSNNMPYGINTVNMQVYADDSAAAAGGIVAIGDTYIETSTGYFKKRLT